MTKEEPKEKKKRRKPLPITISEEQFTRLLECTPSMHHKTAFLLAFESGLRISEITALKPEYINVEKKRIFIKEGKGCKDRVVRLPCCWQTHLIKYIPIACSNRALQKAFEQYSGDCGLRDEVPGVHFHSLRHGFATHLYEQTLDIEAVSKLLGHSDVSTTMIYVNRSPEKHLKLYEEAF